MELPYNMELERDLHTFGVYTIETIKTNEPCVVCKDVNGTWDSDVLPCGHTAHRRCFRRYLFIENVMSCPTCGLLEFPDICRRCLQTKENHDKRFLL